jgi:hypothetical protein
VRLDAGTGVLILEAKGVDLGERANDLRRAVRRAVNSVQSRQ